MSSTSFLVPISQFLLASLTLVSACAGDDTPDSVFENESSPLESIDCGGYNLVAERGEQQPCLSGCRAVRSDAIGGCLPDGFLAGEPVFLGCIPEQSFIDSISDAYGHALTEDGTSFRMGHGHLRNAGQLGLVSVESPPSNWDDIVGLASSCEPAQPAAYLGCSRFDPVDATTEFTCQPGCSPVFGDMAPDVGCPLSAEFFGGPIALGCIRDEYLASGAADEDGELIVRFENGAEVLIAASDLPFAQLLGGITTDVTTGETYLAFMQANRICSTIERPE